VLVPFWIASCSVVGYPAGRPPGSPPAPTASNASPPTPSSTAASTPASGSGAGRTYEVFGVRYRVLDTADGYLEEGIASWYGGEFHGRPTSSGEIFDQNRVSAAHRTLPLHTWVEVENLENGRQIVVRVNDRGPFAHTDTRIIDLSRAAADDLGYLPSGTARVRVRAVDPPSGDDSAP
jgi:rare lipoprotein A